MGQQGLPRAQAETFRNRLGALVARVGGRKEFERWTGISLRTIEPWLVKGGRLPGLAQLVRIGRLTRRIGRNSDEVGLGANLNFLLGDGDEPMFRLGRSFPQGSPFVTRAVNAARHGRRQQLVEAVQQIVRRGGRKGATRVLENWRDQSGRLHEDELRIGKSSEAAELRRMRLAIEKTAHALEAALAGAFGNRRRKPPHQISRADAKIPSKYRAARDAADKAGVGLEYAD